ncbi:MAG: hypothetical protein KDA52_03730, partial [Planctomycetaceae bacterium]|nr:hypothetical protein [Planctomycetaceae bacterium]
LTAKQAEKANISNSSLPKAFAELGKHAYENGEPISEAEETFTEIKSLLAKVEAIREKSQNQPEATTLSDKAKSLASTTGAAAQTTMIRQQINQQFVALGKTAFENPEEWPDELTMPISDLQQRLSDLDTEIRELKQQVSSQREAAGQVVSTVAESGRGFLFKSGVVCTSAVMCAPFGLILIWLHPTWDKSRRLRWTAISVSIFLLMGIAVQVQKSGTQKALAEADRLWDGGDQVAAIDQYRDVLSNWSHLDQSERSRAFRRVIEFDSENGNPESAREMIERANSLGVDLPLTSPVARHLMAQTEREERTQEVHDNAANDDDSPDESWPTYFTLTAAEESQGWRVPVKGINGARKPAPPVSTEKAAKLMNGMDRFAVRDLLGGDPHKEHHKRHQSNGTRPGGWFGAYYETQIYVMDNSNGILVLQFHGDEDDPSYRGFPLLVSAEIIE